jgi:hypothetical protein
MVKKKKHEEVLIPIVKEKRVRQDVKDRKEANKDTEFTCVKMSFNSLVENNYLNGGMLRREIRNYLFYIFYVVKIGV